MIGVDIAPGVNRGAHPRSQTRTNFGVVITGLFQRSIFVAYGLEEAAILFQRMIARSP